ncbi:MAG: thiamine pyrophosphate-dependent enzyme [Dehalococcoidia bacterium]
MELTGGQVLAQSLKIEGVDTLFALPGIQMDYLFDAIWEEREHYRVVHPRHEQATAYMADGFARATGRVGTAVTVPGPGLLNAAAGLSTAYACNSPVLMVSGQIASDQIGKGIGALHEVRDQLETISAVTKSAERALRPSEIPAMVRRSMRELQTGRPRPAEIEVPPDVLAAVEDVTLLEPESWSREELHRADPDLIEEAARLLGRAERPLICSGGGVLAASAWDEVRQLSAMLEAPVLMTSNGRGAVSDRDYHAQTGRAATMQLVPAADAILVIGSRFALASSASFGGATAFEAAVVQIEIDPEELGRNHEPAVGLLGDAKGTARALLERIPRYNRSRPSRCEELEEVRARSRAFLAGAPLQSALGAVIREELPDDGFLVAESTQVGYWAQGGGFEIYEPRTMVTSGYQGTLGYGFATALGVQVGQPERKVVSINGDGGFMYNVQELATQVQQQIPLVTVVFNDNAYGNVRRIQTLRYNGHTIATRLHNPDFVRLAESFGMEGIRANGPEELRIALRRALADVTPALIEVPMPPSEELEGAFPMQQLPPRPKLQ